MSNTVRWLAAALLIVATSQALAQETTTTTEATAEETAVEPTVLGVLEAILLPRVTQEARQAGVPEGDVQIVLDASRESNLSPQERREILERTTEEVRINGPVDNFGAFVQARLAEGLRGRALADAIHAEHQLHGKGKGPAAGGKGNDMPQDRGRPDHEGDDHGQGGDRRDEQGKKNEKKGGAS